MDMKLSSVSPVDSCSDSDILAGPLGCIRLVEEDKDQIIYRNVRQDLQSTKWSEKESDDDQQNTAQPRQSWEEWQASGISHGSGASGWKPWTVRAPTMVSFIAISVALASVLEVLAQKSRRDGVLSPSPSMDDIPSLVTLASLYLPTVIAVVYSLLWSWIELHVKKIQPWFELCKSGGATAENSLLLDYPFEFLAFVPFTAARRGHWPVFYAGTIIMMIFWLITPLQSAIFGSGSSSLTQPVVLSTTSTLIPVQEHAMLLDASVLNGAYATTWLGQPFPSSMTAESAVLPFRALQQPVLAQESIWTGKSLQITTDLHCWPAIVTRSDESDRFDNGQGCSADLDVSIGSNSTAIAIRYIGYYEDASLDWFLSNPSCNSTFRHQFLAIAGVKTSSGSVIGNVTAQFCEPSYYKQNITVAISEATLQPNLDTMTLIGQRIPLTDDEFNRTALEYLMATGLAAVDESAPDYTQAIESYPRILAKFGGTIAWPVTNMVGFAAGSTNYTAVELLDPIALTEAFTAAHRSIFSVAVSKLLSNVSETQMGSVQFLISGIIVSRPISAVVELLLLVVAVFAGLTLFHCTKAVTMLQRNPSSIAELMRILQHDESLLSQFSDFDRATESELLQLLGTRRFESSQTNAAGHVVKMHASYGSELREQDEEKSIPDMSTFKAVQPKELRVLTGAVLLASLTGGAAFLVYLKHTENMLGGLPRPSENFEVLQILENYIPTIFATFLEPFWIVVSRIFCLVQPFRTLERGRSLPGHSIEIDYTSLPPQLTIWRSIRSRHYLLTSICTVALLANVLAVGLGGIFNESPVDIQYDATFVTQYYLSLSRETVYPESLFVNGDHFQVVLTNVSEHTNLPPWTSPELYFFPFAEQTGVAMKTDNMQTTTRGVFLEPRCSTVSTDTSLETHVHWVVNSTIQQLSLNFVADDGSRVSCGVQGGLNYNRTGIPNSFDDTLSTESVYSLNFPQGQSAMEVSSHLASIPILHVDGTTTPIDNFCSQRLLGGWLRASSAPAGDLERLPDSTFVQCAPVLRTALYDVTVDSTGQIIDYELSGDLEDMASLLPGNQTQLLLNDMLNLMTQSARQEWHNTTKAQDWMNRYLEIYLNSTSLIDPNEPAPDANVIIPALEAIYQELAAVLFGRNPALFRHTNNETLVDGFVLRSETRIFMSNGALIVSLAILGINIVVALVVYIRGLGVTLPRLPSTIGSTLGYVAASRAVREYEGPRKGEKTHQAAGGQTYTYGRFIGWDGKPHVGIELDPFVLPLETSRWNQLSSARGSASNIPAWV